MRQRVVAAAAQRGEKEAERDGYAPAFLTSPEFLAFPVIDAAAYVALRRSIEQGVLSPRHADTNG